MTEQERTAGLPAQRINCAPRSTDSGGLQDIQGNFAVNMAMQIKRVWPIRLQKRFYTASRAICANVYWGFSSQHRRFAAHGNAATSSLMKFVLVKVAHLFFKCAQPFFELTFALGQRKLLILERETLAERD
ncbi:hypothetical protein [Janthinobacterium psychrotolerans]|uniref:hypothetical protein n=1 Tax=Janthinobacterium psychrotolerans TaxID=1747903 RepID=UPI0008067A44|nr:hypothetical protein [Janthinobacterium psychrotolerans]